MQNLIEKLTTKTSNVNFTTGNSLAINRGLAKLTDLHNLTQAQINFVFAMYLDEHIAYIRLKAHLVSTSKLEGLHQKHVQKIVNGALTAYKLNSYRVVCCYKCKGSGKDCQRCAGTGKTSKKPKEYELCHFNRSTWLNKSFTPVRTEYDRLYDVLQGYYSEINKITDTNSGDGE